MNPHLDAHKAFLAGFKLFFTNTLQPLLMQNSVQIWKFSEKKQQLTKTLFH